MGKDSKIERKETWGEYNKIIWNMKAGRVFDFNNSHGSQSWNICFLLTLSVFDWMSHCALFTWSFPVLALVETGSLILHEPQFLCHSGYWHPWLLSTEFRIHLKEKGKYISFDVIFDQVSKVNIKKMLFDTEITKYWHKMYLWYNYWL